MDVQTQTTVRVKLELTQKEAAWLKGIMQNPLWGEHPDEESSCNAKMRHMFWEELSGVDGL